MIDYQRIFHIGYLVNDLQAAMAQHGRGLELEWAIPYTFEALPLWTPEKGLEHLRLEVTYSRQGPQHIEIQKGPPGSYYDPALHHGFHVGVWVDDVTAEVNGLLAQGWQVAAAGAPPAEGYGMFVYLTPPGGGVTVELVSSAILPGFERWWSGEPLG